MILDPQHQRTSSEHKPRLDHPLPPLLPTKAPEAFILRSGWRRPGSPILKLHVKGWPDCLQLRATFSPSHPLADTFHPPYPPIASQSISPDVPLARARAFQLFFPPFWGVAKAALYCAHRATTVSSWGLCEQKGHLAAPSHSSEAARCASTGDQQTTLLSPFYSFLLCQMLKHSLTPQDGILLGAFN